MVYVLMSVIASLSALQRPEEGTECLACSLHLIPLRQGFSLNLELGQHPGSPSDPFVPCSTALVLGVCVHVSVWGCACVRVSVCRCACVHAWRMNSDSHPHACTAGRVSSKPVVLSFPHAGSLSAAPHVVLIPQP